MLKSLSANARERMERRERAEKPRKAEPAIVEWRDNTWHGNTEPGGITMVEGPSEYGWSEPVFWMGGTFIPVSKLRREHNAQMEGKDQSK